MIKVKVGPKHSDINIKLLLNIIWSFINSFCMLCAYTIETQIPGQRLQDPLVISNHDFSA